MAQTRKSSKPTPAQLRARKLFAERARAGAFKRAAQTGRKKKRGITKSPSPAQLAARAKFVAMVRAKAKKKNPPFGRRSFDVFAPATHKKGRKKGKRVRGGVSLGSVKAFTAWGAKRKGTRRAKKAAKIEHLLGGGFLSRARGRRKYKKAQKSWFSNPAQRAACRELAMRDNPGRIRFSEADLARYAPKIKGLSLASVAAPAKKKKRVARFKKPAKRALARAFSGSGFLGLGRSRKTVKARNPRGVSKRTTRERKVTRAKRQQIVYRRQHGAPVRSRVRGLPNPSPASVFSEFRGKDVRSKTRSVGHGSGHLTVAQLGHLRELKLSGKKLSFGGKALLCADGRKRLHIGGTRFKATGYEEDMGEVHSITYRSDKPHIETGTFDYVHKFGEDGGKRPRLIVDAEGYPFFEGGSYKIDADGIIN